MHCFTAPRLQIIHTSEILVVDDSIKNDKTGKSKNIIVGDYSMPHIVEAFEADKKILLITILLDVFQLELNI